jgi:hypothetical protein
MDLGFRCPLCGSPFFRTIHMPSDRPWTRQCKGRWVQTGEHRREGHYAECSYTWTSDFDRVNGLENLQEPQRLRDLFDLRCIQ